MSDFVKLIGAIGENADKLGAIGILLLCFVGFCYALFKDILVTGNRFREHVKAEKEFKEALNAANTELDNVKEALIRLQAEKEFGWYPRSRQRRSATE